MQVKASVGGHTHTARKNRRRIICCIGCVSVALGSLVLVFVVAAFLAKGSSGGGSSGDAAAAVLQSGDALVDALVDVAGEESKMRSNTTVGSLCPARTVTARAHTHKHTHTHARNTHTAITCASMCVARTTPLHSRSVPGPRVDLRVWRVVQRRDQLSSFSAPPRRPRCPRRPRPNSCIQLYQCTMHTPLL